MSSGTRDILFFGSVSSCIIGCQVKKKDDVLKLENRNGGVTLRSIVRTPNVQVEEVFGAVSQTSPFEIVADTTSPSGAASLRHQRGLFHPVMIELSHDAAAAMPPSDDDVSDNGSEDAPVDLADEGRCGHLSLALDLYMDFSASGTAPSVVATKTVILRDLQWQASRDICTVAKIPLYAAALTATDEETVKKVQSGAKEEDAIAVFFVLLRVVDLSEKVFMMQQAENEMRRFLDMEPPIPYMNLIMQRRTPAPYGCMPVTELYKHYRLYYSSYYSKVLRQSEAILNCLVNGGGLNEEFFPYRWNTLSVVSLKSVLVGEEGMTPLLATLSHCSNLRELHADRNCLGDFTCVRLAALFSRHRYLATLSLTNNSIYESGGDALLRLARRNRRITALHITGNGCSDTLQKRLKALVDESRMVISDDPLNVLAPPYGYLVSPNALPQRTHLSAMAVWSMLCATPVGDIDVWTRNSTTRSLDAYEDSSIPERMAAAEKAANAPPSTIPVAARAPLLNEIMRTVSVGVNRVVADAVVRSVFMDIESTSEQWERRRQEQAAAEVGPEDVLPDELSSALRQEKAVSIMSPDELYAASFLRIIVVTMRGIANSADWNKEVAPLLRDLGQYQRELGVMEEDYWLASHIFIKALQVCCGAEDHTDDRLGAFLLLFALGIRTAVGPTKVF